MRNIQMRQLACGFSESLLIAEALGENTDSLSREVSRHLVACASCQEMFAQYRRLCADLHAVSTATGEAQGLTEARRRLDLQLDKGRRPQLQIEVWRSPVGDIRIGATEKGVALVEFVRPAESESSAPRWQTDFAVEPGGEAIATLTKKLEEYFSGKITTLDWIVDDVLMRSDFQRKVLRATAEVPYGTLVTYQSIADTVGQPKAVRAVAQALRFNPVPIHIPCHRVIGSDGALTGYAGNLVEIKQKILAVEGILVVATAKGLTISRSHLYVGWRREHCFCRPDCSSLQEQAAGDRAFIPSQARAEKMGYEACDVCRPDLHPLT
jgi:methylated-DNA-[protein]-cysteine S-methyltransferase